MGHIIVQFIMIRLDIILYFWAVVGIIVVYMAIHTWGDLPKNQIDSQLISEAITEAITNHEADPAAHLGTGESLEQHKSNEIIDHPALSVVADKVKKEGVMIDTDFTSLDSFYKVGLVSNSTLDGVALTVAYPTYTASKIAFEKSFFGVIIDDTKDLYWETQAVFTDTLVVNGSIGLISSHLTTAVGFGFQVRSGSLYIYNGYASAYTDEEITGFDIQVPHIYSAKYDHTTRVISFYIDYSLVGTLTVPNPSHWYTDNSYLATISIISQGDAQLWVSYFYFIQVL